MSVHVNPSGDESLNQIRFNTAVFLYPQTSCEYMKTQGCKYLAAYLTECEAEAHGISNITINL